MSAQPQDQQPALLREDRDGIATLTLNRPQSMNLLTSEMLDALQAAFESLQNDSQTRVVILAGAGKAFCAGHDLKEIRYAIWALESVAIGKPRRGRPPKFLGDFPSLPGPKKRGRKPRPAV